MRQARDGDRRPGEAVAAVDGLERLKSKAWGENYGMSRMEAMEKYVKIVTDIAPQWKVAHLVQGGAGNEDDAKAPVKLRRMVWVIKVAFERVDRSMKGTSLKLRETAENGSANGSFKIKRLITVKKRSNLRATSFFVLQAEGASQARAFYEDKIVKQKNKIAEVSPTPEERCSEQPVAPRPNPSMADAPSYVSTGRPYQYRGRAG